MHSTELLLLPWAVLSRLVLPAAPAQPVLPAGPGQEVARPMELVPVPAPAAA